MYSTVIIFFVHNYRLPPRRLCLRGGPTHVSVITCLCQSWAGCCVWNEPFDHDSEITQWPRLCTSWCNPQSIEFERLLNMAMMSFDVRWILATRFRVYLEANHPSFLVNCVHKPDVPTSTGLLLECCKQLSEWTVWGPFSFADINLNEFNLYSHPSIDKTSIKGK